MKTDIGEVTSLKTLGSSSISEGDVIAVTLACGTRMNCTVVRASGEHAILVPVGQTPANTHIPSGIALAVDSNGSKVDMVVESNTSVPAFIVSVNPEQTREREYFRVSATVGIQISTNNITWHSGYSKNISEGGILISDCACPGVDIGRPVYIRLHIPQSDAVYAEGIIVRFEESSSINTPDFAVEFTEMHPEDKKKLVQFIYYSQVEHRRID